MRIGEVIDGGRPEGNFYFFLAVRFSPGNWFWHLKIFFPECISDNSQL